MTENTYQNIIKVYYITRNPGNNRSAYTIEYYYDEVIDNTKTEVIIADVGQEIRKEDLNNKIIQNIIENYRF